MDEGLRRRGGQTENRGAEHRGHPRLIARRLLEESETGAVSRTYKNHDVLGHWGLVLFEPPATKFNPAAAACELGGCSRKYS